MANVDKHLKADLVANGWGCKFEDYNSNASDSDYFDAVLIGLSLAVQMDLNLDFVLRTHVRNRFPLVF